MISCGQVEVGSVLNNSRRCAAKICPILGLIILNLLIVVNSAISEELVWYKEAIDSFKEGRLSKAKEILKNEATKSNEPSKSFYALDLLAQQCINSYDWQCTVETNAAITPLIDKVLDKEHAAIYKLWYASVFISLMPEFEQVKLKLPSDTLKDIGWMINVDSFRYVGIQLRSAKILRNQHRYDEASDALKRATVGFFSIPSKNWYDISISIINITDELIDQGEMYKAFKWLYTAEPYLETVLVPNGPDYARYKIIKAKLATGIFPISSALVNLYKDAYERITKIDYNKAVRQVVVGECINEYITVLMLNGQYDEAFKLLDDHPLKQVQEKILGGEHNASPETISYAASYVILHLNAGKEIDPRWETVLTRARDKSDNIKWEEFSQDYTTYMRDYIDFALGAIKIRKNLLDGANLFSSSALSRIDNLKKIRNRFSDSFPLVNIWDKILVQFGILAGIDTKNGDLVVAGAEVIDRTYQSYLTDSKSVIAAQNDEAQRQIARTWLRRVSQRNDFEIKQLSHFIEKSVRREDTDVESIIKDRLALANALETEKEERKSINGLTTKPILPSIVRVQNALKENEAFLKITFAAGKLVNFCIKKDSYVIPSAKVVDLQKFFLAIKTIENSLNYSGLPDSEGASIYPVSEAIYVWETLSRDVGDCLASAENIVISAPSEIRGIPIEALIKRTENIKTNKLEELENNWVGVNWGISYADSTQAFIVSRETQTEDAIKKLSYLGIGNPNLTKEKNIALNDVSVRGYTRGSVNPVDLHLEDLGNLPSTHEELEILNNIFTKNMNYKFNSIGKTEHFLEWNKATEINFRNKTLSMYNVIHFATHALIHEELPGLKEASLVLTPDSSKNQFSDGLLTSTEISYLDLKANIVILSACNSAKADAQLFGNGLSGLSNAFAFAGVPTILASLWELNDSATKDLMSFYSRGIQKTGSNSVYQLHKSSMQEFLIKNRGKLYNHPRYWASIIILGNGNLAFLDQKKKERLRLSSEIYNSDIKGESFDLVNEDNSLITIIRSLKEPNQSKFSFNPYSLDTNGNPIWKIDDPKFVAGKLSIFGKSIAVSGYDEGQNISPLVKVLDKKTGRISKTFEAIGSEGISIGFYESIHGATLYWYNFKINSWNTSTFDLQGNLLDTHEIFRHKEAFTPTANFTFKLNDNDVLISEQNRTVELEKNKLNEFGLVPNCYTKYSTNLYFYNEKNKSIRNTVLIDDYMIFSASQSKDGRILLSGIKSAKCGRGGEASVLILDKMNNYKVIWSDVYAPSFARASYLLDNENLLVFEEVSEPIELFMNEESTGVNSIITDNLPTINFTKKKNILNIIEKNMLTNKSEQAIVASGQSDKLYGITRNNDEFTVFGSRGGHPHIMTFSLQQ